MAQPLVIAHHLIWTAYGMRLPNDPRGSGSKTIRSDIIAELGELHYGRKRVQPAGEVIRELYAHAADVLKHPIVRFNEAAREAIASAFQQVIDEQRYTCYACALLPDHVHILLRKHKHQAEEMINHLKKMSRERLCTAILHTGAHPVWTGGGGWKVFLEHPDEVRRTLTYIEKNPIAAGLHPQHWPFVKTTMGGRYTRDTVRTRPMRSGCEQSVDTRRCRLRPSVRC